ncbi:hypothetical protein ABIQ69_13905 [Agromyces sp. G08B096]|uniref:Cyanophycinase n=1 Tax=Agromyces sp. G08B096 TaxID=3156399 RepID=A0AAU7W5H7_9MICO
MSRPPVPAAFVAVAVAAGLLLTGVTAAPASAAGHSAPIRPTAVLIGGNLSENADILRAIVDAADPDGEGPARARIAIVTAAAAPAETAEEAADDSLNNAAANGLYYSALFERFGAETYAVPVDTAVDYESDPYTPGRADDADVAAEIRAGTAVFFGGGDQMRYVRTLQDCAPAELEAFTSCTDTAALAAIRDVAARGVVAGVSAGLTILQGADMVTGGESYEAWRDGATAGYLDDASALGYLPSGGFGFVDGTLLDSHFTTWGRQGRAVALALATGHDRVLGVDETTALVLDRRSMQGRVVGEQGVSLLDLRAARGGADGVDGVDGVRWTYATAGDSLNLRSGRASEAPGSVPLAADGATVAPVADVWDSMSGAGGEYSLRDLARAVARSADGAGSGTSLETGPQFETTLLRERQTRAWTTPSGAVSFAALELSISARP